MVITNVLVDKKLSEYRSLFEQWQQVMREKHGESFCKCDDQLMLCHALDDGITQIKELLSMNERKAVG